MLKKIVKAVGHRAVEGRLLREVVGLIQKLIQKILYFIYKVLNEIVKKIFLIVRKIVWVVDYVVKRLAFCIISKRTPVENKVIFLTFQGSYTCNPKGIAEQLIKEDFEYPIVWDVKTSIPLSDYPLELQFVRHESYDFYKHLASAKVIVENTNIVERLGFPKKTNQYLMQTWHGSLGIKRLDGSVVMSSRWKRLARNCQKMVDFCLSNSAFETEVFETSYWKGVPSLLVGHARNDIFFLKDEEQKQRIKKKVYKYLRIEEHKKIFLYAPTHRDNVDESYEELNYKQIVGALEKQFGGEWQIVIRLHNRLKKKSNCWLKNLPDYVSDATYYEDMQELLFCTEVGLTDFSSWIFDYVLTRRPGFIIELGLEDFVEQRGFYYPIEETPFPVAKDTEELVKNILAFDSEKYRKDVESFLEARGCMEDGHASERIAVKIKELMEV